MPGYRSMRPRRRQSNLRPVNSIKNIFGFAGGITGTNVEVILAKAVNAPASASGPTELNHGSTINSIWLVIDVCGLGGTGVINTFEGYLIKNPGANLTLPSTSSTGTSNEKKFIIKSWFGMIMRNQDGNSPLHWEGWIKIPRIYRRMGTDDTWVFVGKCTSALTGHMSIRAIYKWFS